MNSNSKPVKNDNESKELLQDDLNIIEEMLRKQLEELQNAIPSLFQVEDDESEESLTSEINSTLGNCSRILAFAKRHTRAEEALLKEITELKKQLNDQRFFLEEIEMERDVLLQQIHSYLETNSSLRVRLEEQRCQTGTLQKQLNADLESRIKLLEGDKEKLKNLNLEKDNELRKMNLLLEQMAKCLRNRDAEESKTEESDLICTLKADLEKALEEKMYLEEKYARLRDRVVNYFTGKNVDELMKMKNNLSRSRSMGDIHWEKLNTLEKNTLLESPESPYLGIRKQFKNAQEPNPAAPLPKPSTLQESRPRPDAPPSSPNGAPVHSQLKALKRDLLNVTRKLESLKSQLVSSGVVAEPAETRTLKRKAKPVQEPERDVSDEQKSGLKNLKNILQDAKNLNVKLQNLRDEKQKIIESSKKEPGVGANGKTELSFQRAVKTLKKAMRDCGEKLDGGVITEEEALAGLVSPFYACILSNSRRFRERGRRTGSEFNDETDTDSLMDDGSTEASSPGEDGGGDNLLKKQISNRGSDCRESKSQTAHLKCKIERFQEI